MHLSDALRRGEPVQSQYNEAVRQYTAARRDLIGRLAETAAGMAKEGATAAETERNRLALSNAVKNNTTDIEKLLVSMARETSAYNDSRRAISETALSQSEQIKVQDAARTSADALNTRTQALIDVWNSAHPEMTFKVHFDDSEIPAWMKSMTTEQLKKSLAIRQNFVENNKDGKKRLKIGGDVKDNPKLYGEIGMMQQLVNARETPATPPRVTTPTKGTKKSGSKSESNDVESRKADTIRERLEMADEQAKAEKEAAAKVEAASIASIIEKGERERRERRFQHEETLREIEDQEAEIYKKIYDQRKKEYERNNKGKRYENTAAGGAGWSKETISKTLSEAEKRQVGAATQGLSADRSKEEAEYGRFLKEMRDREEQSMMDYINDHGTTLQKIIAAEKEMAMKMAEADNEINHGPTSLAKEMLKRVRDRAFINAGSEFRFALVDGYINTVSQGYDSFKEALIQERAWEFGGENIRKFDLVRWNNYADKVVDCIEWIRDQAMNFSQTVIVGNEFIYDKNKQVEDRGYAGRIYYNYSQGTVKFLDKAYYLEYHDKTASPYSTAERLADEDIKEASATYDGLKYMNFLEALMSVSDTDPEKKTKYGTDENGNTIKKGILSERIRYSWIGITEGGLDTGTEDLTSLRTRVAPYVLPIPSERIMSSNGVLSNEGYAIRNK